MPRHDDRHQPGILHIPGRAKPITEASHHNYHVPRLRGVIVKSSNIGAIKIGFKGRTERLSRYVALFGFGHPVSPTFRARVQHRLEPSKWTESALASVSMGIIGVDAFAMISR